MNPEDAMDLPFKALFNGMRRDYIGWDDYFMAIAKLSAYRSKDPCTQVGAVLVDESNRIVGIGYNGFPRPCNDDVFPWYKQRKMEDNTTCIVNAENGSKIEIDDPVHDKKFFVVHAEANAILNSNTANLKNTRLYTTLYPCSECAKLILQSGIKKIYYMYHMHVDRAEYRASAYMFAAARIECVQYKAEMDHVTIDLTTQTPQMNGAIEDENNLNAMNINQNGNQETKEVTKQTNPFLPNYNP